MSAGCLFSGSPCPCTPCVWCSSGSGSCLLPSFASHPSPSCGTCDGGKSPVHCSVVKAEGVLKPWELVVAALPSFLGGGLGRNPAATVASATAWLAVRDSGGLPGGEPKAHLLVGVQDRGRDKGLLQALPTSIAGIVVRDYYVVQV